MDEQWDYALPDDVKADRIIDFVPQNTDTRGEHETYDLVPPEEFDRRKRSEKGLFTIIDDDLTRILRVSADVDDQTITISDFNTKNAGGDTWDAFGGAVDSDIKTDNDDFVEGEGSIRFQADTTNTTDTTIGVENSGLDADDLSAFLARGSVFVDGKLTIADTGIHQVSVRLGSDSNNYYQIDDSTTNDSGTFQAGWNKIRWDMTNKTATGSPVDTAITYAAIFWSRDTTTTALLHLNDTDWGFDNLMIKRGKYYSLDYYSRYAWADTAVVYKENSTTDSDALQVQNDELELVMAKAAEKAAQYLRDNTDAAYWATEYERLKNAYRMSHPSRARVLTSTYHYLESLEGNRSQLERDS